MKNAFAWVSEEGTARSQGSREAKLRPQLATTGKTPPAPKVPFPPHLFTNRWHRQDFQRSKQAFTYFSPLKCHLKFDHVLLCLG